MAKKYENGEFCLVIVTPPKKPLTELSVDAKSVYLKRNNMENGQIQKGHQSWKEIRKLGSMDIRKRAKMNLIFNRRLANQSEMENVIWREDENNPTQVS